MRGGWVRSLSKATPDQQAHPKSHNPTAPGIVDEMAESTCLLACDARVETQSLVIRHNADSESVRAHEINASRANHLLEVWRYAHQRGLAGSINLETWSTSN